MIYGYARVSTKKQIKGTSLADQEELLRENGAEKIYSDAYTGTSLDRPKFDELLRVLKEGDTFMVTKMDRFARTVPEATTLIRELISRGVRVHILNVGVADNTPIGKLMVTMLLAFAEFERDLIYERTMRGREIARENGTLTEGRPKIIPEAFEDYLEMQRKGEVSIAEACAEMGISRRTWYNRVREVSE